MYAMFTSNRATGQLQEYLRRGRVEKKQPSSPLLQFLVRNWSGIHPSGESRPQRCSLSPGAGGRLLLAERGESPDPWGSWRSRPQHGSRGLGGRGMRRH